MIRINLLGGKATHSTEVSSETMAGAGFSDTVVASDVSSPGTLDVVIKLIIALGPLVAIYGFQEFNLSTIRSDISVRQAELTRLKAEVESKKENVKLVEKFKADKIQLQKRIETIKLLSSARLRNVKALDAIQSVIPTKVWLTKLAIKDKEISMSGAAIEDNEISAFMQNLEDNIYFQQVELVSSQQKKNKEGTIKEFSLNTQLENL